MESQQPETYLDTIGGEPVVVLREPSSGSTVNILPAIGSNVCRFQTEVACCPVEVLASPPDMAALRELPTRWGAGVLFPYPGRVSGDSFTFNGETIRLLPDPATGNAMHGVVRRREWRVVEMGASPSRGAWAKTALSSLRDDIGTDEWPYAFSIAVTVQLLNGRLRSDINVRNESEKAMPFGLGFHPYVPTPLGTRGSQNLCEIEVPADSRWTNPAAPPAHVVPVGPDDWPRQPLPIGDIEISLMTDRGAIRNHWFSFRDGGSQLPRLLGRVIDRENQVTVSILASREFKAAVFYTPPGLSTASIEPHTGMPNAFNLVGADQPDPGLEVIEPGADWSAWYEIVPSALDANVNSTS